MTVQGKPTHFGRGFVAMAVLAGSLVGAPCFADEGSDAARLRVGVYDNRAIAIAYAPSKYNPVASQMKEYKEAKAAGDAERAKQLEAQGEKLQRKLHRQGFGSVPVDDLLVHVKDRLTDVAKKCGVDVIAWHCNYHSANVEVVDVTDELVKLFDPSEKTLKAVGEIKKQTPVDLDEIEHHHDH